MHRLYHDTIHMTQTLNPQMYFSEKSGAQGITADTPSNTSIKSGDGLG